MDFSYVHIRYFIGYVYHICLQDTIQSTLSLCLRCQAMLLPMPLRPLLLTTRSGFTSTGSQHVSYIGTRHSPHQHMVSLTITYAWYCLPKHHMAVQLAHDAGIPSSFGPLYESAALGHGIDAELGPLMDGEPYNQVEPSTVIS